MFVVTLGTFASGSTWIFNVVRSLFERRGVPAASYSAEDATQLLRNVRQGTRDFVLKAHSMDQALLSLASLVDARFIITLRDPRDSVVSQRERSCRIRVRPFRICRVRSPPC